MRFLVRLIIFLAVVAGALYGGSFLISEDVVVVKKQQILADPGKVFTMVNNLENWEEWTAWAEEDPDMKVKYEGPQAGVGSKHHFETSKGEKGTVEIVESLPPKTMTYVFSMEDWKPSKGQFNLKPKDGGTEIEWIFKGKAEGPVEKYVMLIMKGKIALDLDRGLERLRDNLSG